MNKLILNNKPNNTTNEEFTKAWDNVVLYLKLYIKHCCILRKK